jgi:predicted Co/Zn/Cd cation transporter (cation efflux family)
VQEQIEEKSIIDTMSDWSYYGGTSILVAFCIVCSMTVPDPSLLFEGLSGLQVSVLVFILPATFFLVEFSQSSVSENLGSTKVLAIIMIIVGVLVLFICTTYSLIEIFSGEAA